MCKKLIYLVSFVLVLGLVLPSVANAANLIGWWKFDGDTLDYSGLDNHGTAFGNPTYVAGNVGSNALDFDGDDYVTMDGVANDFTGDDVTMAAWIKTTTTGEGDWFSNNAVSEQYLLCILGGEIRFYEGGWKPSTGVTVNDGAWHHVAATRKNMNVKIYVDAVHYSAGDFISVTTFATGDRWSIAQEWDGSTPSDFYTGTVDDVYLYNRSLTAEQVDSLFNGIAPVFVKAENPDPPDGAENVILPLVQWDLGETAAFHNIYFGTNPTPGAAEFRAQQLLAQRMYYHVPGIVPGTTYYWRIDEVESDGTTTHTGDVWSFTAVTLAAHDPDPVDGAKNVPTDVVLKWGTGATTITHDVYLGTDETQVADGTGDTFKGNQDDAFYTPAGLVNNTTYYWRVDEVEANDTTKHAGAVWRFKTIPEITISDPNLVGWWKLDEGSGTMAVDWSGYGNDGTLVGDPEWVDGIIDGALELNGNDFVRMDGVADDMTSNDMSMGAWVKYTSPGEEGILSVNTSGGGNVILMEHNGAEIGMYDDEGYEVWSGVDLDDGEWHHVMYTRSGSTGSLYTDGVRRGTHTADFTLSTDDRWSIGQEWDSTPSEFLVGTVDDARVYKVALTQAQIAEIMRGDTTLAWNPNPGDKSTPDIEVAGALTWSPGDKASQHYVYFGTDKDAVENADTSDTTGIYRNRQLPTSYTPPEGIEWGGGPYYWRIDEYNADATISEGRIWSFTVADHLIVDDFENYNDYCDRIFYMWGDGWGHSGDATCGVAAYTGNGTGSTVGYLAEPYAEQTIVNGGLQSMPFEYLNDGSTGKALYSEAERTFDSPQDWTRHGVRALTLWFRGYPATASSFNYNPGTDVYTMTVRSGDIWDTSDQFHYVFKRLSGIGSITTKVLSVQNTAGWAKGGVMIRETLDANSPHTMTVMTPSNGVAFQYRGTAGGTSGNVNTGGITAPHWVRLSRSANTFTAEHSTNGSTWETVGAEDIPMGSSVYIGLALTSNNVGAVCKAEFSNVTTTGSVTGQWQSLDIGISSNAPQGLYVAVQDSTGKIAVAKHPDPNAVLLDTWQEWNIDIKEFSGVNTQSITKMFIGVGDRNFPKLGGGGMLYVDDIRLYRPRCLPDLVKPDADLSGNCIVDYPDLQILGEDWLLKASDPGSDNLVGWWKFDGNTNDSSGSGIHGTAVGNPQYAAGYDGDALDVDGDDHVLLGSSSDLNFGDATDFSVSLWIKTSGWQNDAAIISNKDWDSGSNTGWAIAGQSGGSGSWQWNYSGATGGRRDYDPPGPTLSDNQWHHLCVAHDRDAYATFYVDGQYQAQVDISGSTGSIDAGYPTVVGTDGVEGAVWAYWFIGLVDDVRIYNDVLTQSDVLYLAGARLRIDLHADGTIDFKDYAVLADSWLDEELWPQP